MGQRLTQEEAIKRLKEVHSEYSYEKTVYTTAINKIAVICSVHGEFHTRYADHVKGSKCKLCSNITIREKQAMGLDKFIKQASYVHNNYYTYSNSVYVNNRTKITITCKTHGDFFLRQRCTRRDQAVNDIPAEDAINLLINGLRRIQLRFCGH